MSGEEDWENEIDNAPACVPNFSNLEPAFQERNQNNYSSNNDFNQNFGSTESAFGNRKGSDYNQDLKSSETGFGNRRGRGRGGYGMFNKDLDSNDNQESGGFSNKENGSFGDGPKRGGFQRGGGFNDDSSGSGRGRRGGRGGSAFSGFGSGNANQQTGFTSHDGFQNETSSFGRGRRGGRGGSFSGERDGGRGRGFGRGGFRGRNEEVGVESGKGAEEFESSNQAPKVTYIPPPPPEEEADIFKHYQSGINFDKYDDIVVDVSGSDAPPAILTFEEASLPGTLTKNVEKAGYVKLTPIQKHSIPIILASRDLMACAQTGSGKTAAFLLPILAHMMVKGVESSSFQLLKEPEAIIIAPTRELINQIYLDARKFAYGTCIRPVVIYGGTQTGHSLRQISQGCNILCATPGRLLDIIKKEKIGLSKIRFLVLDEADRMLDMGFKEDIETLLHSPGMPSTENRQTLMFSATFPTQIQRLAREILKPDYLFVVVGQVGGACSDVEQQVIEVEEYGKKDKLMEILQEIGHERTMVFVKTKKKADFIAAFLCQEKVPSTSIHGDREQREREIALNDFRTGQCPVIVATSVAARGLDIENVRHVINFDIPDDIDEYVHRIGRTGRCGNTGRAISFFNRKGNDEQNIARSLVKVLSDAHQEVPAWLEEIAFSAHGMPAYNPRSNTFASTDDRKRGDTRQDSSTSGFSPSVAQAEDEDWG
ncbi:PREDICTED: probable ATP-dependent RNA helicase DDX4 [Nanorana parkeri]|uniref:probable ATP-dependent RNA helicase DDX4 n=1 Tax=Nanorana parkeri TaxID=125878 RepID=UPI00085442C2|nr:PREDICTED: probable ATP-dependent RNA helicase DDX4 [Nanorana parkeri]